MHSLKDSTSRSMPIKNKEGTNCMKNVEEEVILLPVLVQNLKILTTFYL